MVFFLQSIEGAMAPDEGVFYGPLCQCPQTWRFYLFGGIKLAQGAFWGSHMTRKAIGGKILSRPYTAADFGDPACRLIFLPF